MNNKQSWVLRSVVLLCVLCVAAWLLLGQLNRATHVEEAVTASAAARGFGGDVTVTAEMNADKAISALTIETPNETDGYGKRASEPEFAAQFVGKTGPFSYGEDGIEALSGATFTSTAVLEALNSLYASDGDAVPAVAPAEGDASGQAAVEATAEPTEPAESPAETEAPAEAPESGTAGDVSRLMRARPASAGAAGETAASEAGSEDNSGISRLMRARPAPLEKEMATHASILAWKIPWTEEQIGRAHV